MSASSHPLGSPDLLRFFARLRRTIGWLMAVAGVATFFLLFRSTEQALVPAVLLVLLYGVWLFSVLLERRERMLLENAGRTPDRATRAEVSANRAEIRMAIGLLLVLAVAASLIAGVLLGSKWMGTVALLIFLYLLVIGGPFWLAEILATGEDARRRPR